MEKLIEQLLQFRFFGAFGNIEERELLSQYLIQFLKGENAVFPRQLIRSFGHFYSLFESMIEAPDLKEAFKKYPELRQDVIREFLKLNEEAEESPGKIKRIIAKFETSFGMLIPVLKLRLRYSYLHRAFNFVKRIFRFLNRVTKGINNAVISYHGKKFQKHLRKKVHQYDEALESLDPFFSFLGCSDKEGSLDLINFDIKEHFQILKQKETYLHDLVLLLGQISEIERQVLKEQLQDIETKPTLLQTDHTREEITDILPGRILEGVLPVEMAYLGNETTESIFYKKFVEQNLLAYKYEGRQYLPEQCKNWENEKERIHEQGPIILCLDSSASMIGKAEQYAKAISFYVLKEAIAQGRKCFLITFSKKMTVSILEQGQSKPEGILRLLKQSFHGGTDLHDPLNKSLELLQTNAYGDADVLLITDGQLPQLNPQIQQRIKIARNQQNRFIHIAIANQAYKKKWNIFDEDIHFHPKKSENLKSLVKRMKTNRHSNF